MQKLKCNICPRNCNVDRLNGQIGYCGMDNTIKVARASLHMWEEPCLSGKNGSGTVFFSGCSLKCVYCQNRSIAVKNLGMEVNIEQLSEVFLLLQEKKANNINLVTPTHYIHQIVKAIELAKNRGLSIPFVYNTGGYEKVENLKLLDGLIDIYLPDLKYKNEDLALRYSNAPGYFEIADKAIEEMVRQVKNTVFEDSIMKKGVIVRHMILPGNTKDSKDIICHLYNKYGNEIFISIMSQYTPFGNLDNYLEINRKITKREYDKVVNFAIQLGVENAFIQYGEVADESFIPDFMQAEILNELKNLWNEKEKKC